jgi:antitoxin component HigA of HigAB toxin-antitoxin module
MITNETKEWFMKAWLQRVFGGIHTRDKIREAVMKRVDENMNAERSRLEVLARTIEPEAFKHYKKDAVMGVEILALYPSIDAYCKEMKAVGVRILNEQMITTEWAGRDSRRMALSDFLTSSDGYYIDVYETVRAFRDDAIVFVAQLQKIEKATYGVQEHNRRMLTRFVASLESILQSLIAVSLDLSPQA